MRGAIREFIEDTTAYKVCDAVEDGVSAIQKAVECHCDLILLHLWAPISESAERASLLRSKLPHVKIVGFSTSSDDVGSLAYPTMGFDAVLTRHDGLSKLVKILKVLMPEPPRE